MILQEVNANNAIVSNEGSKVAEWHGWTRNVNSSHRRKEEMEIEMGIVCKFLRGKGVLLKKKGSSS